MDLALNDVNFDGGEITFGDSFFSFFLEFQQLVLTSLSLGIHLDVFHPALNYASCAHKENRSNFGKLCFPQN